MKISDVVRDGMPRQVMFYDGEDMCPGIMIGDKIACACCGGLFEVDDVISNAREDGREAIRLFEYWVDLSTEIEGDLDDYENNTVLLEMEMETEDE